MKNILTVITLLALLLLAFYLDLVICGVAYPDKMEHCCSYSIPVIGTCAKAKAEQILAQIENERR